MEICYCGLIKQSKAGTTVDAQRVERCNKCNKPVSLGSHATELAAVQSNMMTTLAALTGFRVVLSHGVVSELTATAGFTATSKGTAALENAMVNLGRAAGRRGANAIVGLQGSAFGAAGGITGVLGGDAVGVLLMGTAVTVEADPVRASGPLGSD